LIDTEGWRGGGGKAKNSNAQWKYGPDRFHLLWPGPKLLGHRWVNSLPQTHQLNKLELNELRRFWTSKRKLWLSPSASWKDDFRNQMIRDVNQCHTRAFTSVRGTFRIPDLFSQNLICTDSRVVVESGQQYVFERTVLLSFLREMSPMCNQRLPSSWDSGQRANKQLSETELLKIELKNRTGPLPAELSSYTFIHVLRRTFVDLYLGVFLSSCLM
jgi:hypothetical protein